MFYDIIVLAVCRYRVFLDTVYSGELEVSFLSVNALMKLYLEGILVS